MTGQTEEQFFCLPVSAFFWWHIQLHMSGGAFARYDNSDREEIVNFFFAMLAYFGGSYGREVWWMLIHVIAARANIRVWSTVKYLFDCKVTFQWNRMYGCLAESSKKDKEETFSFNFCKLGIFWWKLCTISSPPSPSCELNCKPWHDIWCISWRIWEALTLCWFIKQLFK